MDDAWPGTLARAQPGASFFGVSRCRASTEREGPGRPQPQARTAGRYAAAPNGGAGKSKGHPLGATGLAQCAELNWQIRGVSEKRQVAGAKVGLQHNLGLGGAAVVTVYRKAALAS